MDMRNIHGFYHSSSNSCHYNGWQNPHAIIQEKVGGNDYKI